MNLDRPETRQVKPIACASVGSLSLAVFVALIVSITLCSRSCNLQGIP